MDELQRSHDIVGFLTDALGECFWVIASQNRELLNARPILINPVHVRYIDGNKIAMDNGINWFMTDKAVRVLRALTAYEVLFEDLE